MIIHGIILAAPGFLDITNQFVKNIYVVIKFCTAHLGILM